MNFVLKPSLEHMTIVKIGISLWNRNDVRDLISELNSNDLYISKKWEIIERKLIEELSQISLPQLLKEKVYGVVKPIGLQILEWMQFHDRYSIWMDLRHTVDLPAELCWTPEGTIDRRRTARVLVRHESLDLSIRYKLACMYYLEDNIYELWNCSIEDPKKSLLDTDFYFIWDLSNNDPTIKIGNAYTSYQDQFEICVQHGNKVAVEYLLKKLTQQEIDMSLVEAANNATDADVLCFLLGKMNEEEQTEVFKNDPYGVLTCFLQWPLQSFFIEIVNYMWDFLSEGVYDRLLRNIIGKIRDGYKDWNYQELFREFWQKSPNAQKSLIISKIDTSWLLRSLIHTKNKEIIRLILKDANLASREKFIYSDNFNNFFEWCIHDNDWEVLEFCIREFFQSKDEMLKFKEESEKRLMTFYSVDFLARNKQKWDQLFHFSDKSVCKCSNNGVED